MKKYYKHIKSFSTLFTGTIIAQALSFLFAPIVSRLYSLSDFGTASLVITAVALLTPICTLRYNQAIFLPKDDSDSFDILQLSLFVMGIFCVVALVCIIVIKLFFPTTQYVMNMGAWAYTVPVLLLVHGFEETLKTTNTRLRKYNSIASGEIVGCLLTPLSRIGFAAILSSTIGGLIGGLFIAKLSSIGVLLLGVKEYLTIGIRKKLSKENLLELIRKYVEFPKYSCSAALMLSLSQNMPLLIFGQYFPAHIIGLLAMTRRIVRLPINTITTSMQNVLTPLAINKKNNDQPLLPLYLKMLLMLFFIGLAPFLFLYFFSETIMGFYLGDKWALVGRFTALLVPAMFIRFLQAPAPVMFLALRRQDSRFWMLLINVIGTTSALLFGAIVSKDPEKTLIYYSFASVLCDSLLIFDGYKIVREWDISLKQKASNSIL